MKSNTVWLLALGVIAIVLSISIYLSFFLPGPTSTDRLAKEPEQRIEHFQIQTDEREITEAVPTPVTEVAVDENQRIDFDDMPSVDEERLSLWQASDDEKGLPGYEDVNTEPIQVDLDVLSNLYIDRELELPIPQENVHYVGHIRESHNELNDKVQVWSGDLDDGVEQSGFTITRGKRMTYVVVAAASGTYQIDINNESGKGVVVDMREFAKFHTPDDAVIDEDSLIPESVITPQPSHSPDE